VCSSDLQTEKCAIEADYVAYFIDFHNLWFAWQMSLVPFICLFIVKGLTLGFGHVESEPLARSFYRAEQQRILLDFPWIHEPINYHLQCLIQGIPYLRSASVDFNP
jgi:hypothetical protein